ncbi:integrator complex subunit 10-like [Clavelina lepadiformis]|uniref:integrator complex subunit 10-like n=1 Tax=Clavelina lepadiformis TaxID=159417 RepID=UPI004043768C
MGIDDENWLLSTSKSLVASDVFATRSWLLTAKSIFPQSLRLQIEEYHLEVSKKNIKEASRVLNEIFRDFASDSSVWEEIESLIQAVETSNDALRKAIFESLPALTQQKMILISAECRVNITQYCKLMLILMNKFPESISEYGNSLIEKLVDLEKSDSENTVMNLCRKLLVREVLPVVCRSGNINISNKHFYKWLQKSTEFYATYYTSEAVEGNVEQAWLELEQLRTSIALQCDWNSDDDAKGTSLSGRMSFIQELFRRSRIDVDGNVNRKQIFYTAIILLFEGASKYIEALEPSFYRDRGNNTESYIIVMDTEDDSTYSTQSPIKHAAEINIHFQVARGAWSILHTNEIFEKDFNHLNRRWKCDRWVWFQLFIIDLHVYEGDHKGALNRLQLLEEKLKDGRQRKEVICRVYCHMVSTCFILCLFQESCHYIFECLSHLDSTDFSANSKVDNVTHLVNYPSAPKSAFPLSSPLQPPHSRLKMVKCSLDQLLPFWVHIFLVSLKKISPQSDQILGHLMVLSQHQWPKWRPCFMKILNKIHEKRSFHFELFFKYIINVDILEEICFLKNQQTCKLVLCENSNSRVHVTRGVNREAEDDFWNSVKRNIQRSMENVDVLIRDYLASCQENITSCLSSLQPT